jgi:serine/threonine protein kinase
MHSPRDDNPTSERTPKAGDRIAGKYVVERVVKRGGMGVVLAARHEELSQTVAIKVLLPELSGDASMVARFLREGRAASALRSDHVVRVYDVGRLEGGTPYLVMELLRGNDLDRIVKKNGPLPWPEAVAYVMQVCEALVEAHALGIVHRDLKPSNLFLADLPSGVTTVKVLDFGISKAGGLDAALNEAHAITTTEAVLGSPTFMAPEQLKSAKYVDARADIWSLGLVLYFLIAGKLAFDAETLGSYLVKILQEPAIPLRSFRPDVSEELAAIIHRCLEKDPAHRFATATDFRAALAPFAPFAAHVSGMYAAARVSGAYAASSTPLPVFTGLSPSAPTPAGGLLSPSLHTPSGRLMSPSTPAAGVPLSSLTPASITYSSSGASSRPPHLSSTTQSSWTSADKRSRSKGLRWAAIAAGLGLGGLVALLVWPKEAPPAVAPSAPAQTASASISASASTSASAPAAPSAAPTAAETAPAAAETAPPPAVEPPPSPTASASALAAASASVKAVAPVVSTTPKTKSTATIPGKRIQGPMETDL